MSVNRTFLSKGRANAPDNNKNDKKLCICDISSVGGSVWGVWLDLSCVHVYRPPLQSVQQAVAAGPRRTAQPAGQQRPASQPVSVFCNFLFLLLPHFLCIYVCVCPALDPDFTAISRASALVPLHYVITHIHTHTHPPGSVPIVARGLNKGAPS